MSGGGFSVAAATPAAADRACSPSARCARQPAELAALEARPSVGHCLPLQTPTPYAGRRRTRQTVRPTPATTSRRAGLDPDRKSEKEYVVQTTEVPRGADPVLSRSLAETDPEVQAEILAEQARQESTLEMIASENFAPLAVMQAQGSVLTNKYAEGYPGRRYYGGCEHVDVVEQLAIDRLKALFGAEYANVQPHSGAQANAAAMAALLEPGDTILGLDLAHGGHLTHGMKLNFSGKLYDVAAYHVAREDHRVDMAEVEKLALERRPKLIVAGWSAYPRQLDFAEFRRIADEVGAYLMVDMAHFAGLVAAGLHPSPVPHAHVVTSTTHKIGRASCRERV